MNVLPFIIALILAIGLSGTLFCILTARRIAHRLRNIAVAVHTWSQGEFQVAIADASADELGLLSADLNQMALQVQTLLTTRQQLALLEERQRVARDLHDSVKQQTFAVTLLINAARKALDKDLTVAHTYLAEAEELSDQTRQELTVIIQEMRPLALLDRGLIVVLQEYIERWSQRNAIAAELRFQQAEQALSPEIEEVLLRVTQEALANIARHSGATQVSVELTHADDQLHLHIRDNGHGFAVANALGKGLGLASMRERVESVQGMLHIESNTSGTRIEACLPSKQACTGASKGER
jgi:NarL family two-component system sensor histidine kinase LiaS